MKNDIIDLVISKFNCVDHINVIKSTDDHVYLSIGCPHELGHKPSIICEIYFATDAIVYNIDYGMYMCSGYEFDYSRLDDIDEFVGLILCEVFYD